MKKFFFIALLLAGIQLSYGQDCVANFTFQVNSQNKLAVDFKYTGTTLASNDTIRWNFGDGTDVQYVLNPSHTFSKSGTYNVCIRIKKAIAGTTTFCIKELCQKVTVSNEVPCTLVAAFSMAVSSTNKYVYSFTNKSTGFEAGDSILWTFSDGSSSRDANPTHTFAKAGAYKACLIVKKSARPACASDLCQAISIPEDPSPCAAIIAGFKYEASATNKQAFTFVNTTSPFAAGDTIRWNFGDGSAPSYDVNPSHTFPTAGTYNVCIRVKKPITGTNEFCIKELCQKVVVAGGITEACNMAANFTLKADETDKLKIYFTNVTSPFAAGDTIRWNFGDGSAVSYDTNPTHTFTKAGTYNVCIRVKRNASTSSTACVKEICKKIVVGNPNKCELALYPNPATENLTVPVKLEKAQQVKIRIFNNNNLLMVQMVKEGVVGENKFVVNLANLTGGIYRVVVNYEGGECTGTFLKN